MRQRSVFWFVSIVLLVAAGLILWRPGRRSVAVEQPAAPVSSASASVPAAAVARAPGFALVNNRASVAAAAGHGMLFARRVSNTTASVDELTRNEQAVLLRNALIDTTRPLDLNIPANLRAATNTRSYIVQARGLINDAFRAALNSAGGRIVDHGYFPNNAFLVRMAPDGVSALSANPLMQAVLPYEPFYKLDDRLLNGNIGDQYRVLGYPGEEGALTDALRGVGAEVLGQERSALGTIYTIRATGVDVAALARIDELQLIEPKTRRVAANDLTRVILGVSTNTTTLTNYLGLDGTNILVNINDSGVDTTHPDLAPRVFVDTAATATDPSGHGTHVTGTILSSGVNSTNVAAAGSVSGANFRGMAPAATAFEMRAVGADDQLDATLQEQAAATNALISNESWSYAGAHSYDLAAASWDAAARDARPYLPGSQPLMLVFAAGGGGFGNDDGLGGESGSVSSPGTAKNVITVGASELPRNISNEVVQTIFNGTTNTTSTNQPWAGETDSQDEVAAFSGRGNVGAGIEGERGRFKPDVVAPGVFVVSTRPKDWDQFSYYNPTNRAANRFRNLIVPANGQFNNSIFVPANAVQLEIQVLPNALSPSPFPQLPIYVRQTGIPPTNAAFLVGTGDVSLPPDRPLSPVGGDWFYTVVNPGAEDISVDIRTILSTTNDLGNYYTVLSNLNETLDTTNVISQYSHLYRYESGSSMSAAAVSGMLVLMEQFFEQRMQPLYSPSLRPSPALLKALVINGARSLGPIYDLGVSNIVNYEGWGIANLTNSLPPTFSNLVSQAAGDTSLAIKFYDQAPTNALTTGQSRTRRLVLTDPGRLQPLRVTLVWTDPPGNPAAGPKLVNDLDLIVTNLDTGDVYWGNDIPVGQDFNQATVTNSPPNIDVINNVENVFLNSPLATNFAVTVSARRVNVNAVTAQTNGIAQDYALVISSGDGGSVTNAFSVTDTGAVAFDDAPLVTIVQSNGVPLLGQHVGANDPMLTTTSGSTNQWHFFIYTNTTTFTNVAFVTFLPPDLSVPRIGVEEVDLQNATRIEADIDLYVSTDPTLINLNPAAIAASRKSLSRGGTEAVILSNATPNQVFFIGVKSEDQMAAEFGFLGVSSEQPFSFLDENGNEHVLGLSMPVIIPDGTPNQPGGAFVFALAAYPIEVRKVVVTNTLTHQSLSDLLGNLSHAQQFVVLNNHRVGPTVQTRYVYDDSGEFSILGAQHTDGPGTLRNFVGEQGAGVWMLTMVDSSLHQTGRVDELELLLAPVRDNGLTNTVTLQPQSFFYDVVNVPPEATNLTVIVANMNPALPVELYIRKGAFPTRTAYDKFALINPPGGSLSVGLFDTPPLTAGRYYIGIYNPNLAAVTLDEVKKLDLAASPISRGFFGGGNLQLPLLDDAVSRSTIGITNDQTVARVQVGVVIEHSRVSDLALTLVSPIGTRVLLAEDRGGLTTNGYGNVLFSTNVAPASSSGGPVANTNVIHVGANSGTLQVNYTPYDIPDQMQVFYDNAKIWDTGIVSGTNIQFSVNFGPGSSTDLIIVMNPTNNANTNTIWDYTATVISSLGLYSIFTDDTNLTTTPIKFAVPPFSLTNTGPLITPISGFEGVDAGTFVDSKTFDGWTVQTNPVVVSSDSRANAGTNYLELMQGTVTRTFPTLPGRNYTLKFATRQILNNYVTNGSFEVGAASRLYAAGDSIGAWLVDQGDVKPVNVYPAKDGIFGLDLTGTSPGGVHQDVSLPVRLPYSLKFSLAGNINAGPTVKQGHVYWQSNLLSDLSFDTTGANGDYLGWSNLEFSVTGLGLNNLRFDSLTVGDSGPMVDAVSLTVLGTNLVRGGSFEGVDGGFYISNQNFGAWIVDSGSIDVEDRRTFTDGQQVYVPADAWEAVDLSGFVGDAGAIHQDVATIPGRSYLLRFAMAGNIWGDLENTNKSLRVFAGTQLLGTNVFDITGKTSTNMGWAYQQYVFRASGSTRLRFESLTTSGFGPLIDDVSVTPLPTAQLQLGSGITDTILGTDDWVTNSYQFAANGTSTTLTFEGLVPGLAVDTVWLEEPVSGPYYLPEEPLSALIGQNAKGTWTLEVWDTRVGASNDLPRIVSWQLDIAFANTVPLARPLTHGLVTTNTVGPNAVQYFFVDVPLWASYATNSLFNNSTTNNLDLIYNANGLPYQNVPPGDSPLLLNVPDGTNTLFLPGPGVPPPPLVPGSRYFLAVSNTSSASVTYSLEVEFDITTLSNAVAFPASQPGLRPRYYQFDVSTNALAVLFQTYNADGNVDLVVRHGLPLPDLNNFDYGSFNLDTNDEFVVVTTNSSPVKLTSGRWYIGVFNLETNNVDYTIRVTEFTSINPLIGSYNLTGNSLCLTWSTLPTFTYYVVGKVNLTDPVWVPVSPSVVATALTTTWCIPLPTPYQFFRIAVGSAPGIPDPGKPLTIAAHDIAYFVVPVPDWPAAATNTLVQASLPVDLLFNQSGLPTGAAPGDLTLLTNVQNGVAQILLSGSPPLVTNQNYYLGLRNTNDSPVHAQLQVEFNFTPLTNGVPFSATLTTGPIPRYFSIAVPSDAAVGVFEIYNLAGGNLDLVIREDGFGIPTLTSYDYGTFNPGTNSDAIGITTTTSPFPLTANTWNLSVFDRSTGVVGYTVRATTFTNAVPVILDTQTNGNNLCFTWRTIPGTNYFLEGKTNLNDLHWIPLSLAITATTIDATYCIPFPTPYNYFDVAIGDPLSNQIGTIVQTNGVLVLTWSAVAAAKFQLQWTPVLPTTNWNVFPGVITASFVNGGIGTFIFTDDGTQTGGLGQERFYRLLQLP